MARPLASVSAVPVLGDSEPVRSLVRKLTTALATGALAALRSVATNVPGLSGAMLRVVLPSGACSARESDGAGCTGGGPFGTLTA